MSAVNRAYTQHLLEACAKAPFPAAVAALLPCYWIYWEVGKELKRRGSSNKDYQRWIDQYSGEEYGATVRTVIGILNDSIAGAGAADRALARRMFIRSSEFEYQFWDSAWRS